MPSVAAAARPPSPSNPPPAVMPVQAQVPAAAPPPQVLPVISEGFAKDAILAWFRGEFAAANAIIDALCGHLAELTATGGGSEYEAVFTAIHQRRLNWIPILQMQKYYSVADVALELRKVAAGKNSERGAGEESGGEPEGKSAVEDDDSARDESRGFEATVAGSQVETIVENIEVCSNHEECVARPSRIKLTKGYMAKEPVKGRFHWQVNVLKGLKLFEDIFTESELSKLTDFANELRTAGQKGRLSGETFILFNKEIKGNRRELIQLGIPIFGQIRDGEMSVQTSNIEPIPALLQSLIDHLIMWNLIPDHKRPNSCIVNFFDEGEYSQPFLKPPHLDQPIITLLLSESSMAFGRTLTSDSEGNFKGPLLLSLKEGSLLVMRGNSADMARHVMCPSGTKRISITFFIVRPEANQNQSSIPPLTGAMTLWQPTVQNPYIGNRVMSSYEAMNAIPKWGALCAPLVMVPPMRLLSPKWVPNGGAGAFPKRVPNGGTGVFLPWTAGSRKPTKQLPPRAQKGRLLALPSPVETHVAETISDSGITV